MRSMIPVGSNHPPGFYRPVCAYPRRSTGCRAGRFEGLRGGLHPPGNPPTSAILSAKTPPATMDKRGLWGRIGQPCAA